MPYPEGSPWHATALLEVAQGSLIASNVNAERYEGVAKEELYGPGKEPYRKQTDA